MKQNIDGIKITPLKIISDNRGSVMHMLRSDSDVFEKFGEIYFSTIFKDSIKAWHLHKEATLNYACILGKVKLALFDDRTQSITYGLYQELYENYSIIANCLTLPHNEKEMVRLDSNDPKFKYKW